MHPYIPAQVNSSLKDLKITDEILYWYPWIQTLKNKNIYLNLHAQWKYDGSFPSHMPNGYEYYIVSGDSLMFGWADQIVKQFDGRVIQLMQSIVPSGLDTDRVKYVTYNTAHRRINRVPKTFPINKEIKYKASALTNRISQSKIIIFSALMELLNEQDRIVSLNQKLFLNKNVHNWELSGHDVCDFYVNEFKNKWRSITIELPNDDRIQGSYNNPAYQQSALNFTQESYHYSEMHLNNQRIIQPGPFVTEKTWKCLVSKTAFVPVGQYQTYKWLSDLGLKFDYGKLDLSFDLDPGNLSRLEKLVSLIKSLTQWSAMDLYTMTKDSTEYNYEYVLSDKFWQHCEDTNNDIYNLLADL